MPTLRHTIQTSLTALPVAPRIVHRVASSTNFTSYLVLLVTPSLHEVDNDTMCTGTLINPTTVVTAANCELREFITRAYIGLTKAYLDTAVTDVEPILVIRFDTPPVLDGEAAQWRDIGLATLQSAAPPSAQYMKVNVNSSNPTPRSFVGAVGYSLFAHREDTNPEIELYQVDVRTTTHGDCADAYSRVQPEVAINYESQVCAGDRQRGRCDLWYVFFFSSCSHGRCFTLHP